MSQVLVSKSDGVQRVQFNRPEKKNALTLAMYETMTAALTEADNDPSIRVTLFSGLPGLFTSGNDLKDFMNPSDLSAVVKFLYGLINAEKPIAAAVSGTAIGIGTTMLLHCDLVYAAEDAALKMPFVDLGLVPEAASSALLPAQFGHQRASALLLLGETLSGREAYEFGLVNRVFPDFDALEAGAMERLRHLATRAPSAVRATKKLLKRGQRQPVEEAMTAELEVFAQRLSSPEAAEAFTAFMQRRPADFSRFD